MMTGYQEFSPPEPKWFGVELYLQGSADYQRETFVHAPLEPVGYMICIGYNTLHRETDEATESAQYLRRGETMALPFHLFINNHN